MKKTVIFVILGICILIISICAIIVSGQIKERKREMREIEIKYHLQNDILKTGSSYTSRYGHMPYYEEMERYLQLDLCAYHYYTGKVVSLEDVKAFLENPLNPDGSPRTYDDDETGVIRDFVIWGGRHRSEMQGYQNNMQRILITYVVSHPEIGLVVLSDLSLDQIHMLERKKEDPDFELDLGTVVLSESPRKLSE